MLSSLKIALISCTVIGLTGCGLKIGEKNPDEKVAEVKSAQCLNQAVKDLKIYLDGEATDDQVATAVACLQDVFVAFKENIRGENKNSYTPQEIAIFVEINFLNDSQTRFTPEFLSSLMFFKVALFGGNEKEILKSEIDLIVDFMARFKTELLKLNPHMKILTKNWQNFESLFEDSAKEKQFMAAKNQFLQFITKISTEFANGNRVYKLDDLMNFVFETAKFAKSSPQTLDTIQKARPFLKKFKSYLIGGSASLKGEEWQKMGLTLHEAYFQSLRIEYFLKGLNPDQIEEKWVIYEKIATDLTSLIENLLNTKETQSLSNQEIFEVLSPLSQIIPQADLTPDLLDELGDLKVMILGEGLMGRKGWSQADFVLLNKKIPTLFSNLAVLVQTIDYLSLHKTEVFKSRVTYPEFQNAEDKILKAVNNLSQLIEKSYDLQSFHDFLVHLSTGPFKNTLKLPDNFENLFKAVLAAKTTLTGQQSSNLSVSSIKILMNIGIRSYLNYTEYDLFISNLSLNSLNFSVSLERLWPKIKLTLTTMLQLKPEHIIKTTELTSLVLVLQNENFLQTQLQKISLDKGFDALWSNLLNKPKDRLNGVVLKGFDSVALEQISNELAIWLGAQKNIAQIFAKSEAWGKNEILPELSQRITNEKDENTKIGLIEIKGFVDQVIPLTFNEQGFLQILTVPSGLYHAQDLTKSNFSRALSRLIIRSYAKEESRINQLQGVLKDEVQVAYDQFKPLAVDLDIVDKANTSFVSSRFLEASLFLSVSDGDQIASFTELHHLMLHIFSGLNRAADLRPDIVKACALNPTEKITSQTKVSEDCLLDEYLKNSRSFKGLPQFLFMPQIFPFADVRSYYFSLLKAAGHVPNAQKTVLLSDANLFPHVVQYVEMVFARHDENTDNLLQKNEALKAFPIFKEILKELVKPYPQIKEEDLPGVFIYILKYGGPPSNGSAADKIKFIIFIKDKTQKDWDINSNRIDLGKIFNYIADATRPKVEDPPAQP